MLITGCSNSLLTKFQDKQCISNCDAPVNQRKHFDQPVVQTIQMFLAELGVGLIVLYHYLSSKYTSNSKRKDYQKIPDSEDDDTVGLLTEDSAHATGAAGAASSSASSATNVASPTEEASAAGTAKPAKTAELASPETSEDDKRLKLSGKRVFLLAIPACCDILGTTLMNVGLLLTPVSVFQMVRGAVVLFVGFFSVVFLKRHLLKKQWIGLLAVFGGVFIVGLSALGASSSDSDDSISPPSFSLPPQQGVSPSDTANNLLRLFIRSMTTTTATSTGSSTPGTNTAAPDPAAAMQTTLGVGMILAAQIFAATQFVVEEFILEKYAMDPFSVVMWEGAFGTSITFFGSLLIANLFISKQAMEGSMFNLTQGAKEMFSNKAVLISSIVIMFMMSTFNVTGMTVTRLISATSRSTIDTSRTVGIWVVSLIIGWETFQFLQLVGFIFLVYGTLLFNGIIGNDEEVKENVEEMLPHEFEHT